MQTADKYWVKEQARAADLKAAQNRIGELESENQRMSDFTNQMVGATSPEPSAHSPGNCAKSPSKWKTNS